jgi:hypothetical protein
MLKRCGSIAQHENHVDHHPRSALCSAEFQVSTTSMSRRRLIQIADNIRDIRVSKPAKKVSKILKKKLASRWPLPLDRKFERQTSLFGRSKKV